MQPIIPQESNPAGWPEVILPLLEHYITCEFSTLTRAGEPITYPVTPYPGENRRTIDVSTGLTYPAKAERARRNPKVALLFSNPLGSGLAHPPVVLVRGMATVRDRDLQANADRYVRVSSIKLPTTFQGTPSFLLRRQAWYFARIWIHVTPVRILWWPEGNLDAPPHRWDAPDTLEIPPSDPAPAGTQPSTGEKAPVDWRHGAASALQRFDAPVLTVVDADGFPVSLRVKRVELHQEGFQVDVPTGWPVTPQGPACLTFHTHTPNFSTQENKEFVGNIVPGEAGMVFQVQRQLADWSGGRTRLAAVWSTIKRGRRLTPLLRAEAARRGQSVPAVHLPSEQQGNNT